MQTLALLLLPGVPKLTPLQFFSFFKVGFLVDALDSKACLAIWYDTLTKERGMGGGDGGGVGSATPGTCRYKCARCTGYTNRVV